MIRYTINRGVLEPNGVKLAQSIRIYTLGPKFILEIPKNPSPLKSKGRNYKWLGYQ